jgi:hypothetical protein
MSGHPIVPGRRRSMAGAMNPKSYLPPMRPDTDQMSPGAPAAYGIGTNGNPRRRMINPFVEGPTLL